MTNDPHKARIWREAGVGLVGAVAFIALGAVAMAQLPQASSAVRILSVTASLGAAVAWGFVFATRAFIQADEFLRERDKTAWFWGGLSGVAVSAPVYAFVMMGGLHWLDSAHPIRPELGRAFAMGYGLVIFSQLLGYFVIHAWWKVSKR